MLVFSVKFKNKEEGEREKYTPDLVLGAGYAIKDINKITDYLNITRRFIDYRKVDIARLERITHRQEVDSLDGIPMRDSFILEDTDKYLVPNLDYLSEQNMFTEEEKSLFKEKLPVYDSNFKKLLEDSISYINYLENKQYDVDQWDKANEQYRIIKDARENCYNIEQTIFDTLRKMADRLELITLGNSPLGRIFTSAKADYNLVKELNEQVKIYYSTRGNNDEIDSIYKQLELNIEEKKNMFNSVLRDEGMTDKYQAYYDILINGLNETKQVIRAIREGRGVSESDLDNLDNFLRKTANGYNAFID
ncbi:hypothetical protein ACKLNQ_13645 [Myroides odoratimimus]|uniref:hypothetical protein n=1 Tax=Myroides odoratimimus TaxID=76832 RepID=UPI0038D50C12